MKMANTIFLKTYDPPIYDKTEILRYAGVRSELPQLEPLVLECMDEAADKFTYNVCYGVFPVMQRGDMLDLGFAEVRSKSLSKNLDGCCTAVVFAATVGIGIDRLIARYGNISPTKSLLFQAIGAERIESLCDAFNRDITQDAAQHEMFTRPRFSPGYGDVPLSLQTDIFRTVDCQRKLGLTLNSSLLMSPSKSVTAIIGIGKNKGSELSGCAVCTKKDCSFKRKS